MCVYLLIWGSRRGGWGEQESHSRETECLAEGYVCKCVLWGYCACQAMPFPPCPCVLVCEFLQQMPPLSLADHLTPPAAALDPSLSVWGGATGRGWGEGGWWAGLGG